MPRAKKPLALLVATAILALAACSDVTGPQPVCPIGGGPGTCQGVQQ